MHDVALSQVNSYDSLVDKEPQSGKSFRVDFLPSGQLFRRKEFTKNSDVVLRTSFYVYSAVHGASSIQLRKKTEKKERKEKDPMKQLRIGKQSSVIPSERHIFNGDAETLETVFFF